MMLLPRIVHDLFEFGSNGIFDPISAALSAYRGRDFPYHNHAETEFDGERGLPRLFSPPHKGHAWASFFREFLFMI